jgi:predicted 2-oxoglutarate/Fe(II)-dependent dioxygenase YbiX/peroxiredoxin
MIQSATSADSIPKPVVGSAAPWFKAHVLDVNPQYTFHTVAGRPVLLFFMGSTTDGPVVAAHKRLMADTDRFDDSRCCFFGITVDPADETAGRVKTGIAGIRYILDHDRAVSDAYGAWSVGSDHYEPYIIVLDRQLRVAGRYHITDTDKALALVDRLIAESAPEDWAPVLSVPRVFDRATCQKLIALYDADGGQDSGFMREVDGKTVAVIDHGHKRRSDVTIKDQPFCRALSSRVNHCLRPVIQRAFNFDATRMERYIVACYDASVAGHFRAHRDNTTMGTAHRRFAVTINLNDDFDGGELRFPEFGTRTYRPPPGGAIVFGCGLLHEATQVTRGRRYAFLPFLYDDAAAAQREANNQYLGEGVGAYRQQPRRPGSKFDRNFDILRLDPGEGRDAELCRIDHDAEPLRIGQARWDLAMLPVGRHHIVNLVVGDGSLEPADQLELRDAEHVREDAQVAEARLRLARLPRPDRRPAEPRPHREFGSADAALLAKPAQPHRQRLDHFIFDGVGRGAHRNCTPRHKGSPIEPLPGPVRLDMTPNSSMAFASIDAPLKQRATIAEAMS